MRKGRAESSVYRGLVGQPGQLSGPQKLARAIRRLRLAKSLSQEKLAERASMLVPNMTISVDTVRILESERIARPLPVRRPPKAYFALELIAMTLGVELEHLLVECFSDEELAASSFAFVVDVRDSTIGQFNEVLDSGSLADFIDSMPAGIDELMRLPGVLQLKNAEAFVYIFALERSLPALEMAILSEPPVIFLDHEEIVRWATGMGLRSADFDTFVSLVANYREYSRGLALDGSKRYKIVLVKQTLLQFFTTKSRPAVRAIIEDIIFMLDSAPSFELVILDLPGGTDELEIICGHREIPSSLDSTVSLVIRQTSMSAEDVEYSLVPMPPTLSGLQRDISKVNQYWSLALDQYRASAPERYWVTPNRITTLLLKDLLTDFT